MEPLDFSSMNETDVRELVVRPLITRLGYAHGTQANVRTEVTLRYAKQFLGHKSAKDPALRGRADYICEVVPYGRWVVEVKSPGKDLTLDDAYQAHTYAAHPEIAAHFFLLSNGREFALHSVSEPEEPLLRWRYEDTDHHFLSLKNILGVEGIRKRSLLLRPDTKKPLGEGLPSKMEVVGGKLTYGSHTSTHPLFDTDAIFGMHATVTGTDVYRTPEGLITANLEISSAYAHWAELNKQIGIGDYKFSTADEFVSTDVENPSVFQNFIDAVMQPGVTIKALPNMPAVKLPFGFRVKIYTNAVGYVDGSHFRGVFEIDYHYDLIIPPQTLGRSFIPNLESMPRTARVGGDGVFDIRVL